MENDMNMLFEADVEIDSQSGCGFSSPISLHYDPKDREIWMDGEAPGPWESPWFYGFISLDSAERLGKALIEIARQAREYEDGKDA